VVCINHRIIREVGPAGDKLAAPFDARSKRSSLEDVEAKIKISVTISPGSLPLPEDVRQLTALKSATKRVAFKRAVRPAPAKVAVWLDMPAKADVDPVMGSTKKLRPGARLDWDGRAWTVINLGLNVIVLRSADGEITEIPPDLLSDAFRQERIRIIGECNATDVAQIQERLLSAKEADLEEATRRYHSRTSVIGCYACFKKTAYLRRYSFGSACTGKSSSLTIT
jgi:hypothetical protein